MSTSMNVGSGPGVPIRYVPRQTEYGGHRGDHMCKSMKKEPFYVSCVDNGLSHWDFSPKDWGVLLF